MLRLANCSMHARTCGTQSSQRTAARAGPRSSELETLVSRLDDAAAKRRIYLDLAGVLPAGTISHRRERTRLERLALRDKAVAELMEVSEQSAPPEFPARWHRTGWSGHALWKMMPTSLNCRS